MALGSIDAASLSIVSSLPTTSPKLNSFNKSLSSSLKFNIKTHSAPAVSLKFTLYNRPLRFSPVNPTKRNGFQLRSTAETLTVEANVEKQEEENVENRRKLFVLNLPWSYSVVDIKKLFGECGGVEDVEIIKKKDGKNRGFAFVTMASGEEAQAAVEKFDSYEVNDRIIRVEFSKRFKKPVRAAPAVAPPTGETRHKIYVSNLAWKARSNNLRELFSSDFNPVSVRVVFNSPEKSAGYGFVSFATKEEAESAVAALDGKEVLGRPIRLKISEKSSGAAESEEKNSSPENSGASESKEEETNPQEQPDA